MPIISTPITLTPANAPVIFGYRFPTNVNKVYVEVKDALTNKVIYLGVVWKPPTTNTIHVDVNNYVRGLVNLNGIDEFFNVREKVLYSWRKWYNVRFILPNNNVDGTFTGEIFFSGVKIEDFEHLREGEVIGGLASFIERNKVQKLNMPFFYKGAPQPADLQFQIFGDPQISPFPLQDDFLLVTSEEFGGVNIIYQGTFSPTKLYRVVVYFDNDYFDVVICGNNVGKEKGYLYSAFSGATPPSGNVIFNLSNSEGLPCTAKIYYIMLYEIDSRYYNTSNYDSFLHNVVNVYDTDTYYPTWNDVLKGAPTPLCIWRVGNFANVTANEWQCNSNGVTFGTPTPFPTFNQNLPAQCSILNPIVTKDKDFSCIRIVNNTTGFARRVYFRKIADCPGYRKAMLYFVNRIGGIDWFLFGGFLKRKTTRKPKMHNVLPDYSKNLQPQLLEKNYLVDEEVTYTITTDILPSDKVNSLIAEIITSPALWLYTTDEGFFSVSLVTLEAETITNKDDNKQLRVVVKKQLTLKR